MNQRPLPIDTGQAPQEDVLLEQNDYDSRKLYGKTSVEQEAQYELQRDNYNANKENFFFQNY